VNLKTPTLVTEHLYFGLEAARLRDAAGRVLSRVRDVPEDLATVALDELQQDFRLGPGESRAMAEAMIQGGLLERLSPHGVHFGITAKFRSYAQARIVDPLSRSRAQFLLNHIADVARNFNRRAARNKYEIDTVVVFGSFMTQDSGLPDLTIGITGRRRAPGQRNLFGRATQQTEGTEQIRTLFETLSGYIEVSFFQRIQDIPRPFSVVFKSES
jgi:hypothetical protein